MDTPTISSKIWVGILANNHHYKKKKKTIQCSSQSRTLKKKKNNINKHVPRPRRSRTVRRNDAQWKQKLSFPFFIRLYISLMSTWSSYHTHQPTKDTHTHTHKRSSTTTYYTWVPEEGIFSHFLHFHFQYPLRREGGREGGILMKTRCRQTHSGGKEEKK